MFAFSVAASWLTPTADSAEDSGWHADRQRASTITGDSHRSPSNNGQLQLGALTCENFLLCRIGASVRQPRNNESDGFLRVRHGSTCERAIGVPSGGMIHLALSPGRACIL